MSKGGTFIMRSVKMVAVATAVVGLVFAAGAASSAPSGHPAHLGPAGPLLQHQVTHQVTHQVSGAASEKAPAVIASGFSGATLTAGGFTPIDAGETLNCPGPVGSTCTFGATMTVQAEGTGSGDAWAICFSVDGNYATCPYVGNLDSSFFDTSTISASLGNLSKGTHTVQTSVFTAGGGTAYNYNLVYNSYKP